VVVISMVSVNTWP
jgi:hypothetical protein